MLNHLFMPEVFGGGEQQSLKLSQALIARGVDVQVLTSRSQKDTLPQEIMDGVPVTRIWSTTQPQRGGRHLPASILWMWKVTRWIRDHRSEIDIVHCHHAKLNALVGVRAAASIGAPCVVKLGSAGRNFDFLSLEQKRFFYGRWAAGRIKSGAAAFVGMSEEMMRDLENYGIERARRIWIPNGVLLRDTSDAQRSEIRDRIRGELGLSASDRVAVFAGRMELQKNVETLLRAFARVVDGAPDARLLLLGDGALMEAHRRLARELSLADRVIFRGRVPLVPDYLAASDLFVLPALAEGMSNAVLEAMSEGLPQVVSKVSGNSDLVVEGETGWLFGVPEDVDALAMCLSNAFALPAGRLVDMGRAARKRAEETFSIGSVADRYISLYTDMTRKAA
ncbi:MAG: glycosyltransferase family 4 protein [Pseudomonadota bacterium]